MGKKARQTLAHVAGLVAAGGRMDHDRALAVLAALQVVCNDLERGMRRRRVRAASTDAAVR